MNWLKDDKTIDLFETILKGNFIDREENFRNLLFGQFQIDYQKEIQHQFIYLKYTNLQPSEIKEMMYFEWQMMLEELKDYMDKEKEEREKQESGTTSYRNTKEYQDAQKSMKGMGGGNINPSNMKMPSGSNLSGYKGLNGGGFKMPKL